MASVWPLMDGTDRADHRNERRFATSGARRYNGRVRVATSAATVAFVAALTVGVSSCGGGDRAATLTEASTTRPPEGASTTGHHEGTGGPKAEPNATGRKASAGRPSRHAAVKEAVSQTRPARLDEAERRAASVVREYVDALDAGDGERTCRLFAPGALDDVRFPRERGSCGASLDASIGYRDPRGFPVYEGSRVARVASVQITGIADARVVATTVTDFAGNREASIEDDVVYLRRHGSRWLIVKPSAALYRAIGVGDIPPAVLAPPK